MKPLGCFVAAVIVLGILLVASYVGGPDRTVLIDDRVQVGEEGGRPVWLAAGARDFEPMLEAQELASRGGRGDGELQFQLAEAKRIFLVESGTPAVVRDTGYGWVDVVILDGKRTGQVGRVQRELVIKK